jgi:hypothetical protein
MKNRALLSCFLAAMAGCLPFLSNTSSSSSNVGGDRISMDTMIGGRKGFVYSVKRSQHANPSAPIVVAELASIIDNIAKLKPRVFGCVDHIDSYEIRCLQEIEIREGVLMRTNFGNFKYNVNAEPHESQLIHIIAEKELVIVPEVATVFGTVGGITYRLESVKELENSDNFLVLTLSAVS